MFIKLRFQPSSGVRHVLYKTAALTGLMTILLANPAIADDTADVSKLLRAGQYAQAIARSDAFLAQHPRDAQMRFLKGVILTEQNKSADAITIFAKLTEDFPELPEPYNNLAVLYAANGQYDKARAALDKAIRTNPTYATAYENLGDVHAKLASQAYDKALQLDSANSGAKSKLTLVRSLVASTAPGGSAKVAVASAAPVTTKPVSTPSAPVIASAPVTTKPATSVATPDASAKSKIAASGAAATAKPAPVALAPIVVAKAAPEKVAPAKPTQASAPVVNGDRDAVLSTVNGWAKAWSAQDVKGYLHFYGNDFETPNGLTRKAWAEERQSRIAGKGRITVKAESPQVSVNGNTATVKFRQTYVSDRLTVNSRKTLVLTKNAGKWQIKQERTGS